VVSGRAYDAERVQFRKRRVPQEPSKANRHPDANHVPNQCQKPMNEAVGHQLQDPSVQNHLLRLQTEVIRNPAHDIRQGHAEKFQHKKRPYLRPSSHITARVNGGRLSVISRLRTTLGSDRQS